MYLCYATLQQALADFTWGGRCIPPAQEWEDQSISVWSRVQVWRAKRGASLGLQGLDSPGADLFSQMGLPNHQTPSSGWWRLSSPLTVALNPDGWSAGQIVPDDWLGTFGWLVPGGRHKKRRNLPETGSCSSPSWPNTPEGVPAAQLVPQWHVTNGDMLLLPCFVRSVALIESNAAGIAQIHMSAERGQTHLQL